MVCCSSNHYIEINRTLPGLGKVKGGGEGGEGEVRQKQVIILRMMSS